MTVRIIHPILWSHHVDTTVKPETWRKIYCMIADQLVVDWKLERFASKLEEILERLPALCITFSEGTSLKNAVCLVSLVNCWQTYCMMNGRLVVSWELEQFALKLEQILERLTAWYVTFSEITLLETSVRLENCWPTYWMIEWSAWWLIGSLGDLPNLRKYSNDCQQYA